MKDNKFIKGLLFPHMAIMWILLVVTIIFMACSVVMLGAESPVTIVSYVLSAYTLIVWCFRIPQIIQYFKTVRNVNKFVIRWLEDTQFRIKTTLYISLLLNTAYAIMQLCMGMIHRSFWFSSLAVYYSLLVVMRLSLACFTTRHKPGEQMELEIRRYRACGIVFLVMNLALSLMVFFMVYWNRTFYHHEITTITMAAYTFTSLTLAIINVIRYRKYNSPVYSATKAISLAASCVSMLTLESTMLTVFNDGTMTMTARRVMLGCTGGVICAFIIAMAVVMIRRSSKMIRCQKEKADGE